MKKKSIKRYQNSGQPGGYSWSNPSQGAATVTTPSRGDQMRSDRKDLVRSEEKRIKEINDLSLKILQSKNIGEYSDEEIQILSQSTIKDVQSNLREDRIQKANATQQRGDSWSAEGFKNSTAAVGDKLSLQRIPGIGKYIPPMLDVTGGIGSMAAGLGAIPYNLQQGNYGQAAFDLAIPFGIGAFGGFGAKTTGQFVNNMVNPFSGLSKMTDNVPKMSKEEYDMWLDDVLKNSNNTFDANFDKTKEDFFNRLSTDEGKKRAKNLGIDNVDKFKEELAFVKGRGFVNEEKAYFDNSKNVVLVGDRVNNPSTALRHEIEHGVQRKILKDKYGMLTDFVRKDISFNPFKNNRVVFTEMDHKLGKLSLKKDSEIGESTKKAKKYFLDGSFGREKSAFLAELQEYAKNQGLVKSVYDEFDADKVKEIYNIALKNNAVGSEMKSGESFLRIFDIINPKDEKNFKIIAENLNKMLSLSPGAAIGLGAASQQEYKNGGELQTDIMKKKIKLSKGINKYQNSGMTHRDSVAHQADKILKYEQLRGGKKGSPLPHYDDPEYMRILMEDVLPEINKIMPNASAMEKGEAMDFVFNAGFDQDNNRIIKDPRAYALQEYYRIYNPSKLDKDGKWAGRKNEAYSFDKEYAETIGKLPENERRILMNKGRDWYYKNTAPAGSTWDLKTQGPHPNYEDTWYGRIWNMNDFTEFDKNNPKFLHPNKRQQGGTTNPFEQFGQVPFGQEFANLSNLNFGNFMSQNPMFSPSNSAQPVTPFDEWRKQNGYSDVRLFFGGQTEKMKAQAEYDAYVRGVQGQNAKNNEFTTNVGMPIARNLLALSDLQDKSKLEAKKGQKIGSYDISDEIPQNAFKGYFQSGGEIDRESNEEVPPFRFRMDPTYDKLFEAQSKADAKYTELAEAKQDKLRQKIKDSGFDDAVADEVIEYVFNSISPHGYEDNFYATTLYDNDAIGEIKDRTGLFLPNFKDDIQEILDLEKSYYYFNNNTKKVKDALEFGTPPEEDMMPIEEKSKGNKKYRYFKNGGEMNQQSLGYKDNSPYKNLPFQDFNTNTLTMDGVSRPILAMPDRGQPQIMLPNSGIYQFPLANTIREIPIAMQGGESSYIEEMKEGGMPDRYKSLGFSKVNTPKRTPGHGSKSHAVVVKDDGNYKLIRFGQKGVSGSPKKEGESETDANRRKSFKARHASNIAKGKTSAAYWANKVKWEDGGSIQRKLFQNGGESNEPQGTEEFEAHGLKFRKPKYGSGYFFEVGGRWFPFEDYKSREEIEEDSWKKLYPENVDYMKKSRAGVKTRKTYNDVDEGIPYDELIGQIDYPRQYKYKDENGNFLEDQWMYDLWKYRKKYGDESMREQDAEFLNEVDSDVYRDRWMEEMNNPKNKKNGGNLQKFQNSGQPTFEEEISSLSQDELDDYALTLTDYLEKVGEENMKKFAPKEYQFLVNYMSSTRGNSGGNPDYDMKAPDLPEIEKTAPRTKSTNDSYKSSLLLPDFGFTQDDREDERYYDQQIRDLNKKVLDSLFKNTTVKTKNVSYANNLNEGFRRIKPSIVNLSNTDNPYRQAPSNYFGDGGLLSTRGSIITDSGEHRTKKGAGGTYSNMGPMGPKKYNYSTGYRNIFEPDTKNEYIPTENLIPIQTEKDELIVLPTGDITPVMATKRHKKMDDDEVTDIAPENAYILSSYGDVRIYKSEAEQIITETGVKPYKLGYAQEKPTEKTLATMMNGKKMTPAELGRKVMQQFPLWKTNNIFEGAANAENKTNRKPYLEGIIGLSELDRMRKGLTDTQDAPQMQMGGPVRYFQDSGGTGSGSTGMDWTGMLGAASGIFQGVAGLIGAGMQRRENRRIFNKANEMLTRSGSKQDRLAAMGTAAGIAGTLAQDPTVDYTRLNPSYLAQMQTRIPSAYRDTMANRAYANMPNTMQYAPNFAAGLAGGANNYANALKAQYDSELAIWGQENQMKNAYLANMQKYQDINSQGWDNKTNAETLNRNQQTGNVGDQLKGLGDTFMNTENNITGAKINALYGLGAGNMQAIRTGVQAANTIIGSAAYGANSYLQNRTTPTPTQPGAVPAGNNYTGQDYRCIGGFKHYIDAYTGNTTGPTNHPCQ